MTASRITLLSLFFAGASTLSLQFLTGCGDSPRPAPPTATATTAAPPSKLRNPVDVQRIIDGDTLEVIHQGSVVRIRLKGIDTPELRPSEGDAAPEPYAEAAKTFTLQHVGPQVDLEFDSDCAGDTPEQSWEQCRDVYGRLLAYVRTADGRDLAPRLLTRGLARVYRRPRGDSPEFDRRATYLALENEAQSLAVGIWESSPP
ncbi:MAG: thermonuclease family protein [Myxococcota bacterium]|nr:thermonuclease family protein [Myxococcota bacterium]